jgi:hypothetical protein
MVPAASPARDPRAPPSDPLPARPADIAGASHPPATASCRPPPGTRPAHRPSHPPPGGASAGDTRAEPPPRGRGLGAPPSKSPPARPAIREASHPPATGAPAPSPARRPCAPPVPPSARSAGDTRARPPSRRAGGLRAPFKISARSAGDTRSVRIPPATGSRPPSPPTGPYAHAPVPTLRPARPATPCRPASPGRGLRCPLNDFPPSRRGDTRSIASSRQRGVGRLPGTGPARLRPYPPPASAGEHRARPPPRQGACAPTP